MVWFNDLKIIFLEALWEELRMLLILTLIFSVFGVVGSSLAKKLFYVSGCLKVFFLDLLFSLLIGVNCMLYLRTITAIT